MVDFDALEAAGIANARERAALIEYLDGLGFTAEEMVAAERHGRLFGLAGDALQRTGKPIYTLRRAADELGVSVPALVQAWSALGLNVADADQPVFSQVDLDGLAAWVALRAAVGEDATMTLLRVLGASMARLAEAGSTAIRLGLPDIQMEHSRDELKTAIAYQAVGEFIPRLAVLIGAVFRHHTISARTYFEGVVRDATASVICGVGFADLTGFTSLTQRLTPTELSQLLVEFAAAVSDVVLADGGRIVKFIGDEVMWVSSTPEQLAKVALDLVEHPQAREAELKVRAGLGYGRVLAIAGDYFGTAVNLAARLVGAAAPGQILASSDVRDELPGWAAIRQEPLLLKGFDTPVTAYDLHLSR
ncbi:adenylate/guanylate cyclase domain-containing protein [Mycobacterium sp. ITM-2016-00318]|uniref:adenylate/guanylate cyclase domain-containing protein n=1 Tax=Mycobacterium sp. ITM-2016-00318 TaxID=2099693 RepID=UPI000CF9AA45|nr:adenylate/guanylate cyclase domain-containing protein [Mycobacterium sp. ITM-2016-00318]WNG91069.1 adenylate/guanylate cyclase domain-containing protein [Mycobacterium sp. ITM-2016-00318]